MAAMSGSRSTPTLFELIRQAQSAQLRAIPKPEAPIPVAPQVAPKPVSAVPPAPPAPRPVAPEAAAGSPAGVSLPRALDGSPSSSAARLRGAPQKVRTFLGPARAVNLPLPYLLLGAAGVLLAVALSWSVGFSRGQNAGEAKWGGSDTGSRTPAVTDPLQTSGTMPVNPDLVKGPGTEGTRPPQAQDKPKASNRTASKLPDGSAAPVPVAPITGDPRVAGMNYLVLGSHLERTLAERAVAFLAENGVQAMMIPEFDKAAKGSNNAAQGRYRLVSALALPGDQTKSAAANKLKADIARLGKAFKQDHKGQTDFAGAFWEKFEH
jgi:hypothetical protein